MEQAKAPTGQYILEMKDIVKVFPGVRALDGVNLRVRPGKVHVIVGENGAGKSTLMKVINGEYVAEQGEVLFRGERLGRRSIQETIQLGIAMIRQELNPIMQMTVAENIFVGNEPQKVKGVVDFKRMYAETQELLDRLNIPYKAQQKMNDLSIGGHQLVEIAKAIQRNASLIIMDEPTSAITDVEVEVLFEQIDLLTKNGVAILYITHKMDEIFRIADDVTVLRDGRWIESGPAEDYDIDKIVGLMVGRQITNLFPKEEAQIGETVLEVKNLTRYGVFEDVSFTLRRGEILGFSGLIGAGRSEVMRAVYGLDPFDKGEIWLHGERVDIRSTKKAIQSGITMALEDRREEGIIPERSVRENTTLTFLQEFKKLFWIDARREKTAVQKMIEMFSVKTPSPEHKIVNLSGGNQQKVILAKCVLKEQSVLILDEPTRGIDVGSKEEIHRLMSRFAQQGLAVIMISSELPEILGMSDRIVVMQEGRVKGELNREQATQESIMKLATGG